jgi:hypothetical protein
MLRCRILGHRFRFSNQGRELLWTCEHGCGIGGRKLYPTPEQARRYAASFNREDRENLGRRAPLVGLFPLRLLRSTRKRGRDA